MNFLELSKQPTVLPQYKYVMVFAPVKLKCFVCQSSNVTSEWREMNVNLF